MTIEEVNAIKWVVVQRPALVTWHDRKYIGVFVIYPGCGKTRIGVIGICNHLKKNPKETVLVVIPTNNLKKEWIKTLIATKNEEFIHNFTFASRQEALKTKYVVDNLIVDEIHTILTDSYKFILKDTSYRRLIGLTASIDKWKEKTLKELNIPIIFRFSYEQALSYGIADKIETYIYKTDFNEVDKTSYKLICDNIERYGADIVEYNLAIKHPVNKASRILELKGEQDKLDTKTIETMIDDGTFISKDLINSCYKYIKNIGLRAALTRNNITKVYALEELIKALPKDEQLLCFAVDSALVDSAYEYLNNLGYSVDKYHSKQDNSVKGKVIKEQILEDFRTGKTQVMLSVKSLVVGLDIPTLKYICILSTDSNSLDALQRFGRVIRFTDGIGYCIYLVTTNTIEIDWVKSQNRDKKAYSKLTEIDNFNLIINEQQQS